MKWLEITDNERRDKSLTIRVSASTHLKFSAIVKYLSGKYGNVSQGDLFERWVHAAYEEFRKESERDSNRGINVD